jgi:hypothetical protein
MLKASDDGRLQVTAGASLLEKSRLVEWDSQTARFNPIQNGRFEQAWRHDVDPNFGRLICWIMFSTGAEFLAKGVCLVRGVELRKEKKVPCYPSGPIQDWACKFNKDGYSTDTMTTTFFGTLSALTGKGSHAPLSRLCTKVCATNDEKELLIAAYDLLRKTIRNRDAHAYVPNVRGFHHSVVADVFCPCFNALVSWLPDGPSILNAWRGEAASFMAKL